MRNLLLALIAVVAFFLLFPLALHTGGAAVSAQPPRVEPEEVASLPAQEPSAPASFDLTLSMQNGADVGGFEFDILYNRAAAQITGVTPASFFGQVGQCNPSLSRCAAGLGPAHKSDRSRVGGYSYGGAAGANGSGTLALIRVQTSASPDSLTFTIANALVVDSQGAPITQNVALQLSRAAAAQIFLPMIDR